MAPQPGSLRWLALEVADLGRARSFYEGHLEHSPTLSSDREVAYRVGDGALVLREPSSVPRGGVHVHYAIGTGAYEEWWDALSAHFELEEHRFGDSRSLYLFDPDDHCVELGERGEGRIDSIFEVVLEVEDLDRSEAFYTALGMRPIDRGTERRRVRLDAGGVEIELWEPQLGLADARGGLHVDLGFETSDPERLVEPVESEALAVENVSPDMLASTSGWRGSGGAGTDSVGVSTGENDPPAVRIRDPDGHYLTFY